MVPLDHVRRIEVRGRFVDRGPGLTPGQCTRPVTLEGDGLAKALRGHRCRRGNVLWKGGLGATLVMRGGRRIAVPGFSFYGHFLKVSARQWCELTEEGWSALFGPPVTPVAKPAPAAAVPEKPARISLSGETFVSVAGTQLQARISESSAKIRAPVTGLGVMIRDGGRLAEVRWTIESGKFDGSWLPIAGRFWHPEKKQYEEGEIPGWVIRLVSLDDFSSNGAPISATIELRRSPSGK
ncbi:MAG: hypothetical protein CVU59_05810 [Deltaproteobacteria bacterium HGW-Deltaproteobacteria-17]|nr:MAG: hypothetical protein CVU59_05810 [Deltaproteobacteria bacterium HGW-Deltaproteobacteria-17]